MQAVVVGGALLRRENEFLQPRLEGREIADHVQPHALLFELADLALQRLDEQPHQQETSSAGRRQFSELNANSVR